jgi:hypothetical protein
MIKNLEGECLGKVPYFVTSLLLDPGAHAITYAPKENNFSYTELNFRGWDSILKCLNTAHMNALAQHADFVTILDRVRPLFNQAVELAVDHGETAKFGIQMMLGLVLEHFSSA